MMRSTFSCQVKGDVEKQLGGSVNEYVVEKFKTQVVAGVNYSLKVCIYVYMYFPLNSRKYLVGS